MRFDFPSNPCNVRPMNLTTFLAQAAPVATGKMLVDWNQLFQGVIALGLAIIGYLTLRANTNAKKAANAIVEVGAKTDAISAKTDAVAEVVNEVKKDVNSGRTKLEEKLIKVEDKLLIITGEKATADEKVRSEQDKAVALAATKLATPVDATAHGPARMGKAISELQDAASETTEAAEKTEDLAKKTL